MRRDLELVIDCSLCGTTAVARVSAFGRGDLDTPAMREQLRSWAQEIHVRERHLPELFADLAQEAR